jgi:hypothetical protein
MRMRVSPVAHASRLASRAPQHEELGITLTLRCFAEGEASKGGPEVYNAR